MTRGIYLIVTSNLDWMPSWDFSRPELSRKISKLQKVLSEKNAEQG